MSMFKCKMCGILVNDFIYRKKNEERLCPKCLNQIRIIIKDRKEPCGICNNSGIDERTYPKTVCSCLNLQLGEIEA